MFSTLRPSNEIYSRPSLNPRDRYLAALAEAKAAEADYLVAEAAQREEEALRRRLEELQLQRRNDQLFRSRQPYDSYAHLRPSSEDRITLLHREIEEEELRRASFAREQELETLRRREIEEAGILALKRKQEEERLALITRRRQEEEKRLLTLRQEEQRLQRARQLARAREEQLAVQLVLSPADSKTISCPRPQKQLTQVPLAPHCNNSSVPRSKPTPTPAPASTPSRTDNDELKHFEEALKLLLGQATRRENAKDTAKKETEAVRKPVVRFVFDEPKAQEKQSVKPTSAPTSALPSQDSTQSKSEPSRAPTPTSSLKEQLETRLNNDHSVEIRDTIQAIFASLADQTIYPSFGNASGSGSKSSTSISSSSGVPSTSVSSGKSKEKVGPSTTTDSATEPTSADVVNSMETIRDIEAAFLALQSDFTFPSKLDFSPPSSPSASPASSSVALPGSERPSLSPTAPPAITKLAYTSRNQPPRHYEQTLSSLLTQLDGIQSYGNEEVRKSRKEVVGQVERALEELEGEVEGRWRVWVTKETKKIAELDVEVKEDTKVAEFDVVEAPVISTTIPVEVESSEPESISLIPDFAQSSLQLSTESNQPIDAEEPEAQPVDLAKLESVVTSLAGFQEQEPDIEEWQQEEVKSEQTLKEVNPETSTPADDDASPSKSILFFSEGSVTEENEKQERLQEIAQQSSALMGENDRPSISSYPSPPIPTSVQPPTTLSEFVSISPYPPSASYPPVASITSSAASSVATIRPYDVDPVPAIQSETTSAVTSSDSEDTDIDTFLMPASSGKVTTTTKRKDDSESDWSEVEA